MTERVFIPGSRWLYLKLYTGQKSADELLMSVIHPFVKTLLNDKLISRYFFIRYSDPEFHIRLRLCIDRVENYGEVFRRFHRAFQPYVDNGSIHKVVCDTYNREIERYGAHTIELLEELFCIDSDNSLTLLRRLSEIPTGERDVIQWKLAVVLLDDTMTAFGYEMQSKMELMTRMATSFKQEFGFTNHAYTKQLNDKYRAVSNDVAALLQQKGIDNFQDILGVRQQQLRVVADKIKEVAAAGDAEVAVTDLLGSIQHMTMNRWFRAKNRLHELMIYNFLSKHYESIFARNRNKTEVPENLKE